MKIIVGLGNIGKEYEKTRHNVGFLALDECMNKHKFSEFKLEPKFKAYISEGLLNGEKVLLVKPTTFMNLSGETVSLLKSFYKCDVEDFIIVYDDKDMAFGKLRFREQGSSGGHNGIKSITNHLSSDVFHRVKIGVGDKENPVYKNASAFVLQKFTEKELEDLNCDVLPAAVEKIEELLK